MSMGYSEDFNSNEGMKHLPLTTIQAYSWVFDQVTKITEGEKSRAALVIADFLLHAPYLGKGLNEEDSIWLFKEKWWPYLPVYHEFGHARGMRAFGKDLWKGEYNIGFLGKQETIARPSVLWYYIDSLHNFSLIEAAYACGTFNTPNNVHSLPIVAGGLNNESRLGKEISERIYRFNGHIAYFGPYLRCKIGSVSYTAKHKIWHNDTSDILHIEKYYKTYHPNFNIDNIQYAGMASFILSSTTYSFLMGMWNFIKTGDPTVRTLTWNGIRLPDVNFYYTRNGLSLEVVTAYQVNPNLWFNLGVETVYYPKRSVEFTPSVRYVLPTTIYGTFDFDVGVVLNGYGHFSGHVGVEWTDPVNPLTLHAKLIHHNANTYVGERNIPSAISSNHDIEVVIAASVNY